MRLRNPYSAGIFASILISVSGLLGAAKTPVAQSGAPKDCITASNNLPAVIQEGRYNILCLRLQPGPFFMTCSAETVPGPHRLAIHPFDIEGPEPESVSIEADGQVLRVEGVAGPNAHLFISYDGPFDPIRDGYPLTCMW